MDIIEEATFSTKFNQVKHEVELYLDSGDGASSSNFFPINPSSVINFSIEETLANWVTKGSLTFFYNPDTGGGMNSKTGQSNDATTNIASTDGKSFYQFRGDGNDRLRLRIIPNLSDTNSQEENIKISDPKHWTLSYLFNIYDMEDIDELPGAQNQASSVLKCLKIYFWDEWYQKMITNIIEYSTAISNTQQKKPTGLAMKEIIDKALKDVPSAQAPDPTGSVAQEDWENGAAEIFFTAPTQTNAYECLMYVYDKHMSDKKLSVNTTEVFDFSLLTKERGREANDVGYLTLKPLSYYFERAGKSKNSPGKFQFEHFFLQAYADSSKRPKSYRAPMASNKSDTVDFKSFKYGAITSYRFVDISSLTNSTEFCSTPVYSFDFATRLYQVEFKTPSVKTAREFISKQYIDQLYKSGTDPEKLFLINLDSNKQKNKNLKPTFSLYGDDPIIRQADGIQKLIYLGVFQNTCINFRTLGLTSRRPGSFIAIDKTDGVSDSSDFEDKFFGQWFVINVKHVFETEIYYNEITAVKIHRFDIAKTKFPNTF